MNILPEKVEGVKTSNVYSTSIKLTWLPVEDVDGYEVYRATSKNGTYTLKRTVSNSTTSYTNTDVSRKKGYYYKLRAYRVINGKKVYSSFSDKKYIKTK